MPKVTDFDFPSVPLTPKAVVTVAPAAPEPPSPTTVAGGRAALRMVTLKRIGEVSADVARGGFADVQELRRLTDILDDLDDEADDKGEDVFDFSHLDGVAFEIASLGMRIACGEQYVVQDKPSAGWVLFERLMRANAIPELQARHVTPWELPEEVAREIHDMLSEISTNWRSTDPRRKDAPASAVAPKSVQTPKATHDGHYAPSPRRSDR